MTENKDKNGLTEKEFLASYSDKGYEKPSVSVDIMVLSRSADFSSLKILLIKRGEHPFLNCWALPGGFIRKNETAYQAASRELEEETSLCGVYLNQVYTFTNPSRDPRSWVMSVAYLALVSDLASVSAKDDAIDAAWFDLKIDSGKITIENEALGVRMFYSLETKQFQNGKIHYENWVANAESSEKLAFDHIEIIIEAFLKLKEKFEHTDLAFNMAGDKFTLPDLQALFELVLCKKLYKTNFRLLVASKVEATGEKRKSAISGKLSAEYTYKAK